MEDSNMNTHGCEILQSDTASSLPSLPPFPSWYVMCCYVFAAAAVVKPEMPELVNFEVWCSTKNTFLFSFCLTSAGNIQINVLHGLYLKCDID